MKRPGAAGSPALASASIQREGEYAGFLILCQGNVLIRLSEHRRRLHRPWLLKAKDGECGRRAAPKVGSGAARKRAGSWLQKAKHIYSFSISWNERRFGPNVRSPRHPRRSGLTAEDVRFLSFPAPFAKDRLPLFAIASSSAAIPVSSFPKRPSGRFPGCRRGRCRCRAARDRYRPKAPAIRSNRRDGCAGSA
jgi:hypothetical protein